MTKTLQLRRDGRNLVLDGAAPAVLRKTGALMKRAEIEMNGRTLPIEITDRRRRGAQLGAPEPVLRLDGGKSFVPDGKGPVRWEVKPGFKGLLGVVSRGADRIEVFLPRFFRKAPEVSVVGTWGGLELVVLSASFVLLSRSRRDGMVAAAAASSG